MTRQEEEKLIARVLSGDVNAFEPLVTENQSRVYHLALRLLGSEADAADAAQDAFLRAYTSLGSFRGDSRFSVWLYRLTNNICIDYLRRQKRQNTVSLETEDEDGESTAYDIPDETWSPEVIAERAADAEAVRAAMAELTPDLREILTMREIGGLSYEELADALGLELGTVRSRLNRARKKLCAILTESGNFSEAAPSKNGKGGVRHG